MVKPNSSWTGTWVIDNNWLSIWCNSCPTTSIWINIWNWRELAIITGGWLVSKRGGHCIKWILNIPVWIAQTKWRNCWHHSKRWWPSPNSWATQIIKARSMAARTTTWEGKTWRRKCWARRIQSSFIILEWVFNIWGATFKTDLPIVC